MKNICLFVGMVVSSVATAQTETNMNQATAQQAVSAIGTDRDINSASLVFDYRKIAQKGTPYYMAAWLPGEVTLGASAKRYTGKLKLDVMNNRLLMLRPQGDSIWVPTNTLSTITLNPIYADQTAIRFQRFSEARFDEASIAQTFVRVLHQGSYGTLIQHPVKTLYKARPNDIYNHNNLTEEIRDESAYYVVRSDKSVERVKLSRRNLVSALGKTGQQLDAYLQQNDTPFKSPDDVARVLLAVDKMAQ